MTARTCLDEQRVNRPGSPSARATGRRRCWSLTDLEWWFQSFALLRDKIAHGGEIATEEYNFDGVPHIWHGEWQLRRAIKQTVANAGHPDILLDMSERVAQRLQRELEEQLPADDQANNL